MGKTGANPASKSTGFLKLGKKTDTCATPRVGVEEEDDIDLLMDLQLLTHKKSTIEVVSLQNNQEIECNYSYWIFSKVIYIYIYINIYIYIYNRKIC